MDLKEVTGLMPILKKKLEKDGWTLEKLATATAEQLTRYKGLSVQMAWRAIIEARKLVHEHGLEISKPPSGPWLTITSLPVSPPPPPTLDDLEQEVLRLSPGEPIPAMSVRVKRIWLQNRLRELRGG